MHKVFCATSAEIYSGNWSRWIFFFNFQVLFQLLRTFSDRLRDILKFAAINIIPCEEQTMAY